MTWRGWTQACGNLLGFTPSLLCEHRSHGWVLKGKGGPRVAEGRLGQLGAEAWPFTDEDVHWDEAVHTEPASGGPSLKVMRAGKVRTSPSPASLGVKPS